MNNDKRIINIGIDINLRGYLNEIKYVFSNFANIGGYAYKLIFIDSNKKASDLKDKLAIYYGFFIKDIKAPIKILYSRNNYLSVNSLAPIGCCEEKDIPFIKFVEAEKCIQDNRDGVIFLNDIVFSSFWMLIGHQENSYHQDRYGNYNLRNTFYLKNALNTKPIVSIYANTIKKYLLQNKSALGIEESISLPYIDKLKKAAIVLSHDVDYPEMIKWIECFRIIGKRKLHSLKFLLPIIKGSCNFWKFSEWVEFEKSIPAKSAFYFMGRQGSLLEYFLGKPDSFYDIKTKKFDNLFCLLRDEGFEIGMHASFNAYKSKDAFFAEKTNVEKASNSIVYGNRHHYWHLNPQNNQDTLKIHEKVGLLYDSSLHFEFYPGFRRGICHPFYPYDTYERREIKVLQLPVAWMDNQFVSHIQKNKIKDSTSWARNIMDKILMNNGILVLDYHVRGMNDIFYPKYGTWLKNLFLEGISGFNFFTPVQITRCWLKYVTNLNQSNL